MMHQHLRLIPRLVGALTRGVAMEAFRGLVPRDQHETTKNQKEKGTRVRRIECKRSRDILMSTRQAYPSYDTGYFLSLYYTVKVAPHARAHSRDTCRAL